MATGIGGKAPGADLPEKFAWGLITVEGKQISDSRRKTFPADDHSRPSPDIPEKATWRRFTADHKLWGLEEADRSTESARLADLLRREGRYHSREVCHMPIGVLTPAMRYQRQVAAIVDSRRRVLAGLH